MQAAKDHPVIILLSTRRECYALVIRNETTLSHVPLVIKPEDVSQLWSVEEELMSRGYTAQQRSFMISKAKTLSKAEQRLSQIWSCIVQPIVSHLQLEVCMSSCVLIK
jgi:hypothetical protein